MERSNDDDLRERLRMQVEKRIVCLAIANVINSTKFEGCHILY